MYHSILCVAAISGVVGRPLTYPDFMSDWRFISTTPGSDRLEVYHGLGEVPLLVVVQAKATQADDDFVYHGIGLVSRDDDSVDPYGYITYVYNQQMVKVTTCSKNNHYAGYTIYTDNTVWDGPSNTKSSTAFIRVLAWKKSSFPPPDYTAREIAIQSDCKNANQCFVEKSHQLHAYPSLVIVRTQLESLSSDINGYFSDAVGAGLMTSNGVAFRNNGYVIYGYDQKHVRVWLDSSTGSAIYNGADGNGISGTSYAGLLEIVMWRPSSIEEAQMKYLQLGVDLGQLFDSDVKVRGFGVSDDVIAVLSAEAASGPNQGFRFPGSGSMSVFTSADSACNSVKCSYGGLTYAYTNNNLRVWKSRNVINIPNYFSAGITTQQTHNASAVVQLWNLTKTTLGHNCSVNKDCIDEHSVCGNRTCHCESGYYEVWKTCEKDLTCTDDVPELPHLGFRARNNIVKGDDDVIEDNRLKHSWYKTSNRNSVYTMPDSSTPPINGSCGTRIQLFVNGTHPDINQLQGERSLLVRDTDGTRTMEVRVRKCNDGSVHYNLPQVEDNTAAYCFDPLSLKGVQEFDEKPHIENWGQLTVKVEMEFEISPVMVNGMQHYNYNPVLHFICANDTDFGDGLFFSTYWIIDDRIEFTFGPSASIEHVDEKMLNERNIPIGFNIRCGVRASTSPSGLLSDMHSSTGLFCGIKVLTPIITVKKSENAVVRVQPTCPIGCQYTTLSGNITCDHSLRMMYPQTDGCNLNNILTVSENTRCGTKLKAFKMGENWTTDTIYNFTVTTKDKDYADDRLFKLAMALEPGKHKIWNNYQTEQVQVIVTDSETYKYKRCYAYVDPHMRTGDGYPYEHQYQGHFILYRNTKYSIEVQMTTTSCNNGRAYCACAIAVRVGGDVFLVNLCGKLRYIGFTSCTEGGILDVRKRNSLKYQVKTPIGTIIELSLRPHPNYNNLMNVDIYMAPKDIGNTEGLCGYVDNKQNNDLKYRSGRKTIPVGTGKGRHYHPEFSEEWRLKPKDRNYLRLDPGYVPIWTEEGLDMFCFCDAAVKSRSSFQEANCSASLYQDCPPSRYSVSGTLCKKHHYRQRRDIGSFRKEMQRRQHLVDQNVQVSARMATLETSIYQSKAENICSKTISTSNIVKEFSHRLKGVDITQAISDCAFDVSASNDTEWIDPYIQNMKNVVMMNNENDPIYMEDHPDDIEAFESQSCLRDCLGRGSCANDTCICEDGFHGPDCSIDESNLIDIDDIQGGGVCDPNLGEDCDCIHVQTYKLLENFVCNITETLIFVDGIKHNTEQVIVRGHFEDIYNGACCFPSKERRSIPSINNQTLARRLAISLSNNGHVFGNGATIYIYNSVCLQKLERDIQLKTHWCFIDGMCIFENSTDPADTQSTCESCLPQSEPYAWTNICEVVSEEKQKWTMPVTVLAVVSCTGFVAVAIVCLIVLRNKLASKKRVDDALVLNKVGPTTMAFKYRRPPIKEFQT